VASEAFGVWKRVGCAPTDMPGFVVTLNAMHLDPKPTSWMEPHAPYPCLIRPNGSASPIEPDTMPLASESACVRISRRVLWSVNMKIAFEPQYKVKPSVCFRVQSSQREIYSRARCAKELGKRACLKRVDGIIGTGRPRMDEVTRNADSKSLFHS